MSRTPGTRLGVYEVGTGQVYRETDTKPKRQVAVKILPRRSRLTTIGSPVFSAKPKSSPRLDHPNIPPSAA